MFTALSSVSTVHNAEPREKWSLNVFLKKNKKQNKTGLALTCNCYHYSSFDKDLSF